MDSFLLIFLTLVLYVIFLFTMKLCGFGKKEKHDNCTNACPDCKNAMERIKRLKGDYLLNYCTFQIFDLKRYRCMDCGWEGLRWEKQLRPGRQ